MAKKFDEVTRATKIGKRKDLAAPIPKFFPFATSAAPGTLSDSTTWVT